MTSEVSRLFFWTISRIRASIRSYCMIELQPSGAFRRELHVRCRKPSDRRGNATQIPWHYQYPDCMGNFNKMTGWDPQMVIQSTQHRGLHSVGLANRYLQNLLRRDFLSGGALIDSQWVSGRERDHVIDPATGEEIAAVPHCGAGEMEVAIAAAEPSFPAWRESLRQREVQLSGLGPR
ncbi:aldehyde dehydrogenase family protein [Bradyrhizobium sp. USDA 4451]